MKINMMDSDGRKLAARAGVGIAIAIGSSLGAGAGAAGPSPRDDGYRGIWYANQPTGDAFAFKYSGGFATYPQQHVPIAIHAPAAKRTFFVYGGTARGANRLRIMAAFYDHETGTLPRPAIVEEKPTGDAHDNPTLALDDAGHLWIFSNAHGTSRPATIFRGVEPYSIDAFEPVLTTNFSYGQPWHLPGDGFLFMHTRYSPGRNMFWMTSPDGRRWDEPRPLASIEMGHYQVSTREGSRVATMFNVHPRPVGLNARTNLYYLETADGGRTWRTVDGTEVETPLVAIDNPALVRDYRAEGDLVYLKDLRFDAEGRPILLYLTSRGFEPGPENGPRRWRTARWTGSGWEFRPFTESDHNYDYGSLSVEPDGSWRILATTDPGPQPFGTGGELVLWSSRDRGAHWERIKAVTSGSRFNQTYPRRPVDAHPDFEALWADGDTRRPSESHLYFTDRDGSNAWRMPETFPDGIDALRPEPVR